MADHDRFVAIVLDGKIISCPKIQGAIPNGQTHKSAVGQRHRWDQTGKSVK